MTTERIDIIVGQTGAKEVRRDIEGVGKGAKDASVGVGLLNKALAAIAIGTIVRELANLSDAYTSINNRIRIFSASNAELVNTEQKLFEISQRTRTDFQTNVQLYNRLAIAAKELGANQGQLLTFTEAVGNAISIAGSAGESARGSLIQLSQAVGTTIVRAEEFNSILEGAPRIAQAAAAGIDAAGGSVAKLRFLIVNQKVTSKEFFDAILGQAPKLAEEFLKTNSTIAQSFTRLNNALIQFVGETNKASGTSGVVAGTINRLADNVGTLAAAVIVLSSVFGSRYLVVITQATAATIANYFAMSAAAKQAALTSAAYLGMGSGASIATVETTLLTRALAFFGGPIGLAISLVAGAMALFALRTTDAQKATELYNEQQAKSLDIATKLLTAKGKEAELLKKQRDAIIDTARANVELAKSSLVAAEAEAKQINVHNAFLVARAGFSSTNGPLTGTEKADIAAKAAALAEQEQRLQELTKTFSISDQGPNSPFNQPTKGKTKAQIIAEENAEIREQIHLLGLSGQARDTETKLVALQKKLREGTDKFQLTANEEAEFRARFQNLQSLRDQDDELQKIKGPMEEYHRALAATEALMQSGKLSTKEYTDTVRDLRIALLDTANDTASGFERGLLKTQKEFQDTAKIAEDAMTNMGKNIEDALVNVERTGKLSFKNLVDSALADLTRLSVRTNFTQPLFNVLGNVGGGLFGSQGTLNRTVQTGDPNFVGPLQPGFATGTSFTVPGGGGVDSTNVRFRASPGERVTVGRESESDKPKVEIMVNVTNNSKTAGVEVQQKTDANGGKSIEVIIDELVANNIKSPGSKSSKALRSAFGATPVTAGR